MKRVFLSTLAAVAAFAIAPTANAADYFAGEQGFQTQVDPATGIITAALSSFVKGGTKANPIDFTDNFYFQLPTNGVGSGSLTTSTSLNFSTTDLDFVDFLLNGKKIDVDKTIVKTNGGKGNTETVSALNLMLSAGVDNVLTVIGRARGNGTYTGQITFTPSVPEAATWAMMIIGFGAVGGAMRYRRRQTKVAFA